MNKILQFSIFILLFTAVGIFVSGTTTITDNFINITNGIGYLNLNGINKFTITNYTFSNNNISWDNLKSYPAACPSGTYLTQLNDSVTCTSISATSYDNLTVTNLTTNEINNILYVQAGNGTDIVSKVNACSGIIPCKIIVPSGNYSLNNTINLKSNMQLDLLSQPTIYVSNNSVFNGTNLSNVFISGGR